MPGLPVTIRCIQSEDLSELHRIDRICFPKDIAFSHEEILSCLTHEGSIARAAEKGGRILGFVLARIEGLYSHVLTLDVIPEARRLKIGTRLMNAFHKELVHRGIGVAILEVSTTNFAAQRLYLKLGYRYREIILGYYRGRENAYRMVKLM